MRKKPLDICRRATCGHVVVLHVEYDDGRIGSCIRLGCNCHRFKEGLTVVKIIVAAVVLATAAFMLLSGCDGAPSSPELVAADATAPVPCRYLPPMTPSNVIPPSTWGAPPASWRFIACEDKKRAICIYLEGQYDLKVMDCSPAPGLTCAWTCE
jgi:hypothetical protein